MTLMGTNSNQIGEQKHNNVLGNPNHYERGLELAEAGKYQEALVCMQEHLCITGGDAEVLNDIGAILH
jgi:hypothetical protein